MKKIIFGLIFLLFSIGLCAQSSVSDKRLYENYGTFNVNGENGNKVSISAFVTVQKIVKEVDPYAIKLEQQVQKKRNYDEIEEYKTVYRYELYLVSKSIYAGDTTSTWIYGAKVFVNGEELTKEKFPDGFMISIAPEPTMVYWYETTSDEKINFLVKWESAVYENRLYNQNR